jgi:hypothetical protein
MTHREHPRLVQRHRPNVGNRYAHDLLVASRIAPSKGYGVGLTADSVCGGRRQVSTPGSRASSPVARSCLPAGA